MKRGKRRKSESRRRGRVAALTAALAFCGTASWAQFPGFYSGAVRPQLENQRQAANAANGATTNGAAASATDEAERLSLEAVIVAVERYESGALPALNGCANDARALQDWLGGNFDAEFRRTDAYRRKIAVLSDASENAVAPTRDAILSVLRQKASVPCDRLFVSFAGHGVEADGKSYLCPADAAFRSATNEENGGGENGRDDASTAKSAENLIAVSEVLEILKNAKAKEAILLLDACRDGETDRSFMREFAELLKNADETFKKKDGGAFYVLTSCSLGEQARETVKNRESRGAFGYYFVEGLAGPADYVGCCDGAVTLVEAYNYAYSKVAEETRNAQTPELFMANVGLRKAPTLARVNFDDGTKGDVDALTDQAYLIRVGRVLSDVKWTRGVNEIGARTWDVVLEGAPNNALALSMRGSLRRKFGDYVGALEDWSKVGQKFQLYVKSGRADDPAKPPRNDAEKRTFRLRDAVAGREIDETLATYDLATVAEIKTDASGARWGLVVEKNNVALGENAGWLPLEATVWDWRLASRAIVATELQATARVVDYNASTGVAPGRNYIQGGGGGSAPGPLYH